MTEFVGRLILSLDVDDASRSIDAGTRVGLMTFADGPVGQFDLNTYVGNKEDLLNAVLVSYDGGKTNTGEALR